MNQDPIEATRSATGGRLGLHTTGSRKGPSSVAKLAGVLLAGALLVGCAGSPAPTSPLTQRVVFARAGAGDVHGFRTPSLAVAPDGTLVAAYSALLHSERDLPNDIEVWVRTSRDDGLHWSAPRRVTRPAKGAGTSDTSLLVDHDSGRMFLFYNYGPPGIGFWNSKLGQDSRRNLHPSYLWSDDDGRSWQGPRDLFATVKQPEWKGMFTASGHGVQLRDAAWRGRLLQPLVHMGSDGRIYAGDIYSDDHGASWHDGASLGPDTDESKAVQLADGTVMQDARSDRSSLHARVVALSHDGGAHFDAPHAVPELPDPHVNGDIIRVAPAASPDQAPSHWLLFSNPDDPAKRRNLTVRVSCDDGGHWSDGRVLDAGAAAYSVMAALPDRTFGILWEDGSGDLDYAHFNLAWVGGCR